MELIYWCLVKAEMLDRGTSYAYRIIKCVKTTLKEVDALYWEHNKFMYENGYQAMLFTREPDDSPLKAELK